ncbi:MAG: hypothetical protein IJH84_08885 [Saccharopolyspora sp.]|uniref:hypothetical protein n=1 Tax=Saccharopolyspora TaxID=1835 RepID=UPI00190E29E6|nr:MULTISPECIES: hypothetical protein [unclassified Saccharopolyspora]MBK0865429.1 hypothetical protein [Saccharopolyspora sp. HNM0986]MBQ6641136.1 hypothetical protein [Saccharopolyspora sp.]
MTEHDAEVSWTATVAAAELTFRAVPASRVDFTGDHAPGSTSGSVRRGVSRPAREEVVYRDVRVHHWILAALETESRASPEPT